MSLTAAAKNTMLDNWGVTQISLHTAFSATGANEVTGGSPAYARQNISFGTASGGVKSSITQPVFNVPATTVGWIGKWMGSTFAGMSPNTGSEKKFFVDVSSNVVTCYGHGYANDQTVVFVGDTPPTGAGISEGGTLYVVNATTDTFQVAATLGGAAIDITAVPADACRVSKITLQVYSSPGTHTVTAGSINLNS